MEIVKITQKGGKKEELKEKMDLKKGEEEREKCNEILRQEHARKKSERGELGGSAHGRFGLKGGRIEGRVERGTQEGRMRKNEAGLLLY